MAVKVPQTPAHLHCWWRVVTHRDDSPQRPPRGATPVTTFNGTQLQRDYCDMLSCMTMTTTTVKDLVCGMDVDPATAAARSEYQGETYYFCGVKCKETFDLDPAQYMGAAADKPKSGGCCG